jgi:hypothetical protein
MSEQGNPGTWIWIGFDGDIFSLHNELKEKGVTISPAPHQSPLGDGNADRRSGWSCVEIWNGSNMRMNLSRNKILR